MVVGVHNPPGLEVRDDLFDQVPDLEGYSGGCSVMRSLLPAAECRRNKDDLFVKGFSYHTTS